MQHSAAVAATQAEPRPCIVVVGGGAIGLLFTALFALTPHPHDTYVVSRSLSARPLSAPPVRVELLPSTAARLSAADAARLPFSIPRSSVFASAAELLTSPAAPPAVTAILLTVKVPGLQQATEEAVELSRHYASRAAEPPLVVPVINGVAHLASLPQHFPPSQLLYGSTIQGSHWRDGDRVRQGGNGLTWWVMPPVDSSGESAHARWFRSLVTSAAMDCTVLGAERLLSVHWSKLLINSVVNPLAALVDARNGWISAWLRDEPAANAIMRGVVRELMAVGRRHGVDLVYASEAEAAAAVVAAAAATADNVSSMLVDVRNGRVTEVDGMCGEVVRLGERYGIETPYNRALWELVSEMHPKSTR